MLMSDKNIKEKYNLDMLQGDKKKLSSPKFELWECINPAIFRNTKNKNLD